MLYNGNKQLPGAYDANEKLMQDIRDELRTNTRWQNTSHFLFWQNYLSKHYLNKRLATVAPIPPVAPLRLFFACRKQNSILRLQWALYHRALIHKGIITRTPCIRLIEQKCTRSLNRGLKRREVWLLLLVRSVREASLPLPDSAAAGCKKEA